MKLNKHKSTVFLEIFSGVFCLIVSTWNNHRFLPGCPYRDRSMEMTEKSTTKKNLIKSKTLRSTPYLRHIQFSKSSQCLLFVCRSIGGESKNLCNIVKNLYCFMSIASVFFVTPTKVRPKYSNIQRLIDCILFPSKCCEIRLLSSVVF